MFFLILQLMLKKALKDREEHCSYRDRESSITYIKYKEKSKLFAKLQLNDSYNKARKELFSRVEKDTKNNR